MTPKKSVPMLALLLVAGLAAAVATSEEPFAAAQEPDGALFQCDSPRGGDQFVTYEIRRSGRYRAQIEASNWTGICDASLCIVGGSCWEHIHRNDRAPTFDLDLHAGQALTLIRKQGSSPGACHAPGATESREQEACRSPSGRDEALFRDTGRDGQGFFVKFAFDRIN